MDRIQICINRIKVLDEMLEAEKNNLQILAVELNIQDEDGQLTTSEIIDWVDTAIAWKKAIK